MLAFDNIACSCAIFLRPAVVDVDVLISCVLDNSNSGFIEERKAMSFHTWRPKDFINLAVVRRRSSSMLHWRIVQITERIEHGWEILLGTHSTLKATRHVKKAYKHSVNQPTVISQDFIAR
jgi:hypothetical protein